MMNEKEYDRVLASLYDYLRGGFRRPVSECSRISGESGSADAGTVDTDAAALAALAEKVAVCRKCRLAEGRKQAVFGEGVRNPALMVVGEGPGAEEDAQGLPFVGPAGKYLDKWLDAIGMSRRKNTYIANIVKCRPPGNRNPEQDECQACMPYLLSQVEIMSPKVILILGRVAMQSLLEKRSAMKDVHGTIDLVHNIPALITYHPSAVLRTPSLRRVVWEDLKRLKELLDRD